MLSNLERDPKKTQEILKYRETDPQYQKKEKPSPKEIILVKYLNWENFSEAPNTPSFSYGMTLGHQK